MQNKSKNIYSLLLFSILFGIVAAIIRAFMMLKGFDFDSKFYTAEIFATIMYICVILCSFALYIVAKKFLYGTSKPINSVFSRILELFSMVIFAVLTVLKISVDIPTPFLEKTTWYISTIAAVVSVFYFLLSSTIKNADKLPLIKIINIAPVIYFISELIVLFASLSRRANSYYKFPFMVAILVLAFYILSSGKEKALHGSTEKVPMLSVSLITIVFLIFSAIPDIVLFATNKMQFTKEEVLLTFLEVIYILIAVNKVILIAKDTKEV